MGGISTTHPTDTKLARMRDRIVYRKLRAPQQSGQALIEPPVADAEALLAENRRRLGLDTDNGSTGCEIAGHPLPQLAASARRQLLDEAVWYTRSYRDLDPPRVTHQTPLLLAGHQPQLFHPGVWFKNFVLSSLANDVGGVAVNLVIDSDTIKNASIAVPTGNAQQPRRTTIPFDAPGREVPYEERQILDRHVFDRFGGEVEQAIAPWVTEPLIRELWPRAIARRTHGATLGECLAQSRHQTEAAWGTKTLELPQSAVCRLDAFAVFAAHVLTELSRFREIYNRTLAEYRRVHRLRNHAQPVPDLAEQEAWTEAPFWIWTTSAPQRRALYVARRAGQIILSDLRQNEWAIDAKSPGMVAEQLAELATQGVKLRTRALTTTLFARLLLGDVFLHGIGGAKYDQVTDLVMQRFFGVVAPEMMTVTATIRLPLGRTLTLPEDDRRLRTLLRELDFHPERHLADSPELSSDSGAAGLIAEKRRWIETAKTPENAADRHRHIAQANQALQPYVAPLRERLERERAEVQQQIRDDQILGSREYAFCLHPAEKLRDLILDLSKQNP